ncbi:MAG TPA: hypothetical protein VIQ05_20785 [Tardiphaga sp.]
MTQREQQQCQPANGGAGWLSTLVTTFEQTEQLGDVRCDERLLSEMRARLARPALPHDRNQQLQPQH